MNKIIRFKRETDQNYLILYKMFKSICRFSTCSVYLYEEKVFQNTFLSKFFKPNAKNGKVRFTMPRIKCCGKFCTKQKVAVLKSKFKKVTIMQPKIGKSQGRKSTTKGAGGRSFGKKMIAVKSNIKKSYTMREASAKRQNTKEIYAKSQPPRKSNVKSQPPKKK